MPPRYDLFISYAHADDRGPHAGKVTALVDAIRARHVEAFPNDPLKEFFDVQLLVTSLAGPAFSFQQMSGHTQCPQRVH